MHVLVQLITLVEVFVIMHWCLRTHDSGDADELCADLVRETWGRWLPRCSAQAPAWQTV